MYKLGLEKAEEPEIKLPTSIGSQRKQGNSRKNIFFLFIDYAKAFVWITTNIQSSSSVAQSRLILWDPPWTAARQASLSIPSFWSILKLMSIELVMPSNHLILCRPLLFLASIFPSITVFSALRIRWPKYGSFSFNISPSNEHPGLISFRMDWLDVLAVQGTLKSLLQYHSAKASSL